MTGKRFLVVCALVLLGTVVVPSGADRQLSGDPRTGGDGLGNQVLDVLSDATDPPTRANNMNTQLSEAGHRMNELNEATLTCPSDFNECGGRCYHAVMLFYNFAAAEEYCAGMGATLATPRTSAENECANGEASAASMHNIFWIGYSGGNTADSFFGADGGGAMTYSNWYRNQPDLDDAVNCVVMFANVPPGPISGGGTWADLGCHHTRYFVCQTPQN